MPVSRIIETEQLPIKSWAPQLEEGALIQGKNLANLPFAFSHIAIMPDCHQGYGMPIGGVLAARGAVIPNAVGVDIGCGMCAVRTSLRKIDGPSLRQILDRIRSAIPVGFKHHPRPEDESRLPEVTGRMPVVRREFQNARTQIGTLGGGNHFIEVQEGSDGHIWIMVHSGSRNIGKQVADYYNRLAVEQASERKHSIPKGWQLAYFPAESKEGEQYLEEMRYCVEFSYMNRALMMDRIIDSFCVEIRGSIGFEAMINIAHNYAAREIHFGTPVYIHRKGAISARKGEAGIIPGSQGSSSYIVTGKGNPESFSSCSHGAGRRLGRKQAIRELDLGTEVRKLEKAGIIHSVRRKKDLDEAAGAYKDIETVMEQQEDLVDIQVKLKPLAVIKG